MIEIVDHWCPPNAVFILDGERFIWAGIDRVRASGIDALTVYDVRGRSFRDLFDGHGES